MLSRLFWNWGVAYAELFKFFNETLGFRGTPFGKRYFTRPKYFAKQTLQERVFNVNMRACIDLDCFGLFSVIRHYWYNIQTQTKPKNKTVLKLDPRFFYDSMFTTTGRRE